MLFNNIMRIGRDMFRLGSSFASISKNLSVQGREIIKDLLSENEAKQSRPAKKDEQDEVQAEIRRQNMQKNFEMPETDPNNPAMKAKMESMKHSQGVTDFSGSSYDGADSPGERTNYNMFQRNFDNHQGN